MSEQKIIVPNIGDFKEVEVIEVLVKEGQEIKKDDSVITLESDKSSVEVPSNFSGTIKKINIKVGDKVSEGTTILLLDNKENSKEKALPASESKNNNATNKNEITSRDSKGDPQTYRIIIDVTVDVFEDDQNLFLNFQINLNLFLKSLKYL